MSLVSKITVATLTLLAITVVWLVVNRSAEEPVSQTATTSSESFSERRGALLDEVVFTREGARGQMTELIASGSHQVAAQGISDVTTYRRVRNSDRIEYDVSYGSSGDLILNPAGPQFVDGTINPFHVPRIREALNWLVDRRHIVEEIYGGLAVPRWVALNTTFPDNARLAETVRRLEVKYQHDPGRARDIIEREMVNLGALKVDGIWSQDGKPLTIRILIRIEDKRRLVGDYVADLFQDLGFDVERMYRAADEASRLWISGDPAGGEWHVYTGGWVSPFIIRDQAGNFNYYYTPRGRPGPLWQAYRPVPEFDRIADRLARREYGTWEERQDMMRRALELSMEDSAHIWLTDQVSIWARSPDVSLAVDLAAGVASSALWPVTLRYKDQPGGQVKVALPNLLAEPWNPIAGSNWVFDLMVLRGLRDAPALPDPFTGLYLPQQIERAEVTVRKDLTVNRTDDWLELNRVDEIQVPADAWVDWDAVNQRWITVGEKYPDGVTTETKVRLEYPPGFLQGRWHDQSQRSIADIVLPWILTFERASESSPLYDPSLAPAFQLFQKTFRGRRIVSLDPLIIEAYGGPIYPDAEVIAATRAPGFRGTSGIADMGVPWHTLALAIRADTQGELAFSSLKADRNRIEWLNFVDGPSLEILARHMRHARDTSYLPFPNVLSDFVDQGDIESRYQALIEWYGQRGHFWVGDGPYYLHAVHAVAGSVVLRRAETFDAPSDKWLSYSTPRIPAFDITGPMVATVDKAAEFGINIRFDGKPYPAEDIDQVSYMVFNREGELMVSGAATATDSGRWRVRITREQIASLGIGGNRLEVAVIAKPVALPSFATHGFATVPAAAFGKTAAAAFEKTAAAAVETAAAATNTATTRLSAVATEE